MKLMVDKTIDKSNLINRLDHQLDWIKSCDTKTSIIIAVIGIFLSIFASENSVASLKEIFTHIFKHHYFSDFVYLFFFSLSWIIFIYGSYYLIRVLKPRLYNSLRTIRGTNKDSLYYFETIAKNDYLAFKQKMINRNHDDEIEDILTQIYVNAKICTLKYSYYKRGIAFAFIGIAGNLILFIIGIILIELGGL